jgi:hypothetical protein
MKAWWPLGLFPPLAHQGGWDELLLVLGPLAVIGGALWLANKRVSNRLAAQTEPDKVDQSDQPGTGES